jgi:hypothetical protein
MTAPASLIEAGAAVSCVRRGRTYVKRWGPSRRLARSMVLDRFAPCPVDRFRALAGDGLHRPGPSTAVAPCVGRVSPRLVRRDLDR